MFVIPDVPPYFLHPLVDWIYHLAATCKHPHASPPIKKPGVKPGLTSITLWYTNMAVENHHFSYVNQLISTMSGHFQ